MSTESSTVSQIFRRAQAIRREKPEISYKELKTHLLKEFKDSAFPSTLYLTIPEQDARAPEEDWTAGLPLVLRGIQTQNWKDIVDGIVLSLEQTENYERERGPEGERDRWHDRTVGIEKATSQAVGKWMPQELVDLAQRAVKERERDLPDDD